MMLSNNITFESEIEKERKKRRKRKREKFILTSNQSQHDFLDENPAGENIPQLDFVDEIRRLDGLDDLEARVAGVGHGRTPDQVRMRALEVSHGPWGVTLRSQRSFSHYFVI